MNSMYIAESKNNYPSEIIFELEIRLDGSILLLITHIHVNELS